MSSDYRGNAESAAKRWSYADLFVALSLGFFVATLLLLFLGLHFSGTAHITPTASSTSTPPAANALERLVNEQRQDHDLPAIKSNAALRESACAKAADMQDKDYFDHVAPDGTQPWKFLDEAGYRYTAAGENLARNFSDDTDLVQAWMDSPTHRENVLGEYKEQGICTVGDYTVQHLGGTGMNVFNKIIDHRIATTSGADAIARSSGSLVTVVFYSTWKRAVYVLGRRIAG